MYFRFSFSGSQVTTFQSAYEMPYFSQSHTAVWDARQGVVYVVGGTDTSGVIRTAYMWRPHDDKWQQLPYLTIARSRPAVFYLSDTLYAAGGRAYHSDNPIITSVETLKMTSTNKRWEAMSSLPFKMDSVSATVVGGSAFIGGCEQRQCALWQWQQGWPTAHWSA